MIYTVTLNPSLDRTIHFPKVTWVAVNRATRSRLDLSGKGVNISIALRQLGVDSVIMGLAGGTFGRALVEGLQRQGFRCAFISVAGETRSNITVIEDETGRSTKLNEPGPTVCEADLEAFEQRFRALLSPGDFVALAGSLPPGAPIDTYARLVTIAHERGAWVALDTSGAPLAQGCQAQPDLIKPNVSEAEELLGYPLKGQWTAALQALRALGPRQVLLSCGADGAVYASEEGIWRAVPPPVTEVNNVGAGDAALAGAIYAQMHSLPPEEIVRWAVAMGTATVQTDGTTFPTYQAVEAVLEHVAIKPVKG